MHCWYSARTRFHFYQENWREQDITFMKETKFPLHVTGIRGPYQHSLLWRHDPTPRMCRTKLEGDEAAVPIDGPWQPGSHPVPGLSLRLATVQCQSGRGRVLPPVVVLRQELERNDCLQWLYQGLPPESLRDGHLRNLINSRTDFSADKSAFFSCFVFTACSGLSDSDGAFWRFLVLMYPCTASAQSIWSGSSQ